MNKNLGVLAFVKTQVDLGKTIWESLSYLVAKVILTKGIQSITTEVLCKEFNNYYRFKIPLHPMNEIINKMCQKKYIVKNGFELIPNKSSLSNIIGNNEKYENYYDDLLDSIKGYFSSKYSVTISNEEVEALLIMYLNEFDIDILSSLNLSFKFPEILVKNEHFYMLNRYLIENCCESEKIDKFFHLIMANICINSIFYSKSSHKLSLQKTFLYLDTRMILRLSGLEGDFRKKEYIAMIELLLSCDIQLRLFEGHYNEVLGILDDCIYWLQQKGKYDPRFASPVLKHFIENKYNISDVIIFKDSIDKLLKQYSIKIDNHDYSDKSEYQFTIDEALLFKIIVDEYKSGNAHFEEDTKENIIWNDVKAISTVFKKRKGIKPVSIQGVKYAFLTINNALAKASRLYLLKENKDFYQYQECMTDTFYVSQLWLNSSYDNDSYLRKKIMANAMSFIELNPEIRKMYLSKLKELKESSNIDENTFYLLRSHPLSLDLLEEKTCNIPENYSDKLPEEIYEELKSKLTSPIIEEMESIQEKYSKMIFQDQDKTDKLNRYIEKKAKNYVRFLSVIAVLLVLSPNIILLFKDYIPCKVGKIILVVGSFALSFFIAYLGITVKSISHVLYKKRIKKIKKDLKD